MTRDPRDRRLLQQAIQTAQSPSLAGSALGTRSASQDLSTAQSISRMALDPGAFGGGSAGFGGLAAQLATAGIGAFAQNRAKKEFAAQELASQEAFAVAAPELAGVAGQLTPESRENIMLRRALLTTERQFAAPAALSPEGKRALDIRAGILPEAAGVETPEEINKKRQRVFKQTGDLRKEFTKNSGEFIKQRDAFNRVEASAEDASAAGDLSLIFNYMKVLDPGSTVREGEFATAQNSGGVDDRTRALFNRVSKGQRLSTEQRNDFVDRAGRLFDRALTSQRRRVDQFRGIAERNQLPVEDVILDLIGDSQTRAEGVEAVSQASASAPITQPAQITPAQAQEELRRRGLLRD